MSGTGGNAHPTYDDFTDTMHRILEKEFRREVPLQTIPSKGLDPQAGLIIGAKGDSNALFPLFEALKDLPEVWSAYSPEDVHCTFSSHLEQGVTDVTPALHESYELACTSTEAFVDNYPFGALPTLLHLELLVSRDTIIVAGTPNYSAHVMSGALLGGTQAQLPELKKRSWGGHLTIARSLGQINDQDRGITDAWLERVQKQIPRLLVLTDLVVGAFTVKDRRFAFDPEHYATFPITR